MKKITLIFLFSLVVSTAASFISECPGAYHIPRDGDRLHPGIAGSESLILSVCDSSRTVLLDPSAISFGDDLDACTYIDSDTISYVQFATKHRFLLHGDTLSYIGYENRATDFRLNSPAIVAGFPFKEGSVTSDVWTGHMLQYGNMMLKHVKGESRSSAEKGWTLTDGIDTLRNAIRLRWTLDMAYADPDSVTSVMSDSIAGGIISDMQVDVRAMLSERLLTERSMWFSEDTRYPVLTDSRVSRVIHAGEDTSADTIPLSMLAIHYPVSFQYSDTGEDYIALKPDGKNSINPYGEYVNDDEKPGTSLSIGEPEANGGTVILTLSSPHGPTTATITLFTDSGIRLTEPKEVPLVQTPQTYTISVPAGWSGVTLLRVDSGNESYTRKVII